MKPSFIKKLDAQLLRNNPVTWSTRIHMIGYYGFGVTLLLVLLCFFVPDDPRENDQIHNWIVLISVISLLAFVTWMIYLLRFNVFKRFGKWNKLDTLKTFLLYFLITLIIVSWPFIPPIVQSIRADNKYSTDSLVRDVNAMNIQLCQLEKDSLDKRFSADTLQLKESVNGVVQKEIYNENPDAVSNNGNYYYSDTASLRARMMTADSIQKLSDSIYVFYECPDFRFVDLYQGYTTDDVKVFSSMRLFADVIRDNTPIDKNAVKKELGQLLVKYSKYHDAGLLSAGSDYYYGYDQPSTARVRDKYDLRYVNNGIANIVQKKYRWDKGTIAASWRAAYYVTICLSLLVVIYRHTTRRTFFLALLSSVVLSILTALFLMMSPGNEGGFYTWVIFYFIGFAIITATVANSRNRNVISGIALNLLVFLTAFIPLVCTALYYSSLRARYSYWNTANEYLFKNESLHYFIAEIAGFGLLVILFATIYRAAYRKWFALPDQ
jgi:hypothetical protein